MAGFPIRGFDLVFQMECWLYDPQDGVFGVPRMRFPHRAERYRPGDYRFRPRFVGVADV